MIGQTELISKVINDINTDTFPKFTIFNGSRGSGKHTLIEDVIVPNLRINPTYIESKIDSVRDMIKQAYSTNYPMLFVILDADRMSVAARNAMLKITEEPPKNVYVIMTLENIDNTLPTIRNRARVYTMQTYTPTELKAFVQTRQSLTEREIEIVCNVCETIGDTDRLLQSGVIEFYDYVNKVVDCINTVSGANAFKIGDKISLKATDNKYDLKLFFNTFCAICIKRLNNKSDTIKYANAITITHKYIRELGITGINKQSLFDCWLLDIRADWKARE